MAGLLEHGPALTALLAPTVNAYKRLVPDSLAPTHVNWGLDNRTAFVRVPNEHGREAGSRYAAGTAAPAPTRRRRAAARRPRRDRARARASGEPVTGDGYRAEEPARRCRATSGRRSTRSRPTNGFGRELGEGLVETFLAMKRFELDRFSQWVTDWELDEYARHL